MRGGHGRRIATVVALGLAACLLAVPGCGDVVAPDEVSAAWAGTPYIGDCMPYEDADCLADYNAVSQLRSNPAFLGADVGASTKLSDGRRIWLFGDTVRGHSFEGPPWVRNSMLLFGNGCARVVLPTSLGAVIPDRGDGVGYWPMSVVSHPIVGGDEVVVTATRVRGVAAGLDFQTLGGSVARFRVPTGGLPRLLDVVDLGPDCGPTDVTWGAALAVGDDGDVFVYGTRWPGERLVFGRALLVARTSWQGLGDTTTWQFWDGLAWVREQSAAAAVVNPVGGVSQTLSVFRSGHSWVAVSKRDDFLGDELGIWAAPSPTGPFRLVSSWVQIPSDEARGIYVYMPLAHPDLPARPGHVIVSVCVNTDDVDALTTHPTDYRPYFLEVPLPT